MIGDPRFLSNENCVQRRSRPNFPQRWDRKWLIHLDRGDFGEVCSASARWIVTKIVGNTIELVIHWQGGDHTRLTVPKNRAGQHRWTTQVAALGSCRRIRLVFPSAYGPVDLRPGPGS
jgi:hypothetical protein